MAASPTVRALVVEDDRSWQQILCEILSDAGLVVDVADSLETAVSILREKPHRLAVVDLSLGGSDHRNQDGLQVLEALLRHDPSCVAMLVTGFATVEIAVSALTEYSAFTCLRKEAFNRAEFRSLVSRALASSPISAHQLSADQATDGDSAAPVADGAQAAISVLVVEDDAGWRSILAELLTDAGHQVRLCNGLGEAMGCLRREKYGLAVIDLSLTRFPTPRNNLDGLRLLASTRAAGIPTIVVSGAATPEDVERAYVEHAIFAYLEKQTFDRRVFRRTVTEALQPRRTPDALLSNLTSREREVLALLAQGMTNREIAEALVITTNTVKRHLKSIFEKMGVHTRAAATARAMGDKAQ
jgi:DNA-binding NarL/FixJ family response regulator